MLEVKTIGDLPGPLVRYRKAIDTLAIRIREPFAVHTPRGVFDVPGQAGGYLVVDPTGILYPVSVEAFERAYKPVEGET